MTTMKKVVLYSFVFVILALMAVSFASCKRNRSGDVNVILDNDNEIVKYNHSDEEIEEDEEFEVDFFASSNEDFECEDENELPLDLWGDGKLLETKTTDDGNSTEMWRFEYDEKHRIIEIEHFQNGELNKTRTITYNGDELVKIAGGDKETFFVRNGNIITITEDYYSDYNVLITVNRNGCIIKTETIYDPDDTSGTANPAIAYCYSGGNLTDAKGLSGPFMMSSEYFISYKFDNKKSPFLCKTPKWFLQHYFEKEIGLKNNVVRIVFSSHQVDFTNNLVYEFDSDGFPTKRSETRIYDGDAEYPETIITRFKYHN